ncbi:unnamed protein product [Cyprideis torosa]|uniref:Uncharacterized protein n=1 Tax=Cyprideis torosa TaxID=163714 RepID=A0A7R8ZRT9_9CRUS|nr:unnamed protein product [Cyprideis torosa]CAG0904545.1 unnamed protein product [Cyprideis torosa]
MDFGIMGPSGAEYNPNPSHSVPICSYHHGAHDAEVQPRLGVGAENTLESAAEFEKSASKRKFGAPEDVEVTTGEEGERNVVHVLGKLFRYDPLDKRWQERGTGQVRLNDSRTDGSSRVVVRTQGSYKLILNSKLFPRMVLERASTKGVKITAVDSEDTGLVRVFLIKCGSPSDAENLESAILRRINVLREQEEKSEKETQDDDQSPVNKRLKTDDASENVEDPPQGETSRQSTSEATIQSTPEAQQTQSLPVHTTEEEESTTPS